MEAQTQGPASSKRWRRLPADATFDAIGRLGFLAKIESGLAELDAGKAVLHDEVKRRLNMSPPLLRASDHQPMNRSAVWHNGSMDNHYTAAFEQVGEWWIGHVEELLGCNVQEHTLEEARESLKEAIQLIMAANRELARRESEGHAVVREPVAVAIE